MRRKKAAIAAMAMVICLSFLQPPKTEVYDENLAQRYGQQLKDVFGEDCRISPGETITRYHMDKDTDKPDLNKPYRFTQWELDYTDAYGCPATFTFSNYGANMTGAVCSHLRDRVESHYYEKFCRPYIEPYVEDGSVVMYCDFYSLFSDPKRPETGVMSDERIQYEKVQHIVSGRGWAGGQYWIPDTKGGTLYGRGF